jgi:hypothetical protein
MSGEILNAPLRISFPTVVTGAAGLSTLTSSPVHLVEERVFTQFNDEVKKDGRRWILNSGTSKNMTKVCGVFTELYSNIHGMVRFGDCLLLEMRGSGMCCLLELISSLVKYDQVLSA